MTKNVALKSGRKHLKTSELYFFKGNACSISLVTDPSQVCCGFHIIISYYHIQYQFNLRNTLAVGVGHVRQL